MIFHQLVGGIFYEFLKMIDCIPYPSRTDTRLCNETIEPLESELLKYLRGSFLESKKKIYRSTNSESYNFLIFSEVSKYFKESFFLILHPDTREDKINTLILYEFRYISNTDFTIKSHKYLDSWIFFLQNIF